MFHTIRRGAPAVLSLLGVATIVLAAGQAAWGADGGGNAAIPTPDPTATVQAPPAALLPQPAGLTNTPPVANNDALSTEENTNLLFKPALLLANDTDADGDTLSVVVPAGPTAHGYLEGAGGGQFLYSPDPGFTGTDSFTYFANDGQANSLIAATVTISVKFTPGINHAPIAVGDSYSTPQNTALIVGAPGIYANDTDPDNDPLVANQVVSQPKHGSLVLANDGSFTYTPNAGFSGPDQFLYLVSDGLASSPLAAQVVIKVGPPVVLPDPIHAVDDAFTVAMNNGLSVSAPGVTANDTDNVPMNVQDIKIGTSAAHGALTHGIHGEFTYIPDPGFVGADTFTYSAYNGLDYSNFATVTITVTGPAVPPITTPTPTPSVGGGGDSCHDIAGVPLASCDSTTKTKLAYTGANTTPVMELAASLLLVGIAGLIASAIARKIRRRES
jgi:hypothetical protein